jgi:HAMP domain-containing protein
MRTRMEALNPASRLRPRLALLVVVAVGAVAALMGVQSSARISEAYESAGRTTLAGMAAAYEDGFDDAELRDPAGMQQRMMELKERLPALHKISVSWRSSDGGTMLVQAGHEHLADGAKRDVSTARVLPGGARAPFDAPDVSYREVRTAGAHYARLDHLLHVPRSRRPAAVLELHYDLKALDVAREREQRTLIAIAVLGALSVGLMLLLVLTRAVVRPVDEMRAVANRIRGGARDARLRWTRRDELGDLGRDLDRMADALVEAEKDPLTGLLNHRPFRSVWATSWRARGATPRRWRWWPWTSTTSRSSTMSAAMPPETPPCATSPVRSPRPPDRSTCAVASVATSSRWPSPAPAFTRPRRSSSDCGLSWPVRVTDCCAA